MAKDIKQEDSKFEDDKQEVEDTKQEIEDQKDNRQSNENDVGVGNKSTDKTFTQEQVTRMMTKEKNQGRMAALKELGIDPMDTKSVAMIKALLESQKEDGQKEDEQKSAEAIILAEAEQRAIKAEAKAEAMQLGAQPQFVEDVVTLALSRLTDNSDLITLIGELKTKYPTWFTVTDEEEKKDKVGQKGTGSSIKDLEKKKNVNDNGKSLGARLAAQRKSTISKSSYWGKTKK